MTNVARRKLRLRDDKSIDEIDSYVIHGSKSHPSHERLRLGGNELSKRLGKSKQCVPSKDASKIQSGKESQRAELGSLKSAMRKRLQDYNTVAKKARTKMDTSKDL